MRLFSFDDPGHGDVMQLLPWYVNGTLGGAERARVEQHVRECVACRRELESQRRLSEVVRSEAPPAALAKGLARLSAQIDAVETSDTPVGTRLAWWRRPALLAPLVLIQLVVIATLLFVDRPAPVAEYRALSTPAVAGRAQDAVVVIFDPAVTQRRVQELLGALDARIVNGPNAHGAYTLEVPENRQAFALERLRVQPDVRFAQPAPGSAGMEP